MDTKVTPFINLVLNHLFYKNQKMSGLEIQPISETADFMRKMGLFFQAKNNELTLAYREDSLKKFEEGKIYKLVFTAKNLDPYFQSKTDLALYSPNEKVFYFDNLKKVKEKNNRILLHETDFVSKEDLYESVSLNRFQHLTNDPDKVTLKNPLKEEYEALVSKTKEGTFQLDYFLLDFIPDLLILKDNEMEKSIYVNDSMHNYFGFIHLYIDLSMLKEQEGNQEVKLNYTIEFENRKTYWRYFLLNQDVEKNTLEITPPIDFNLPIMSALKNGEKALEMISKNAIPLKEEYENSRNIMVKLNESSSKTNVIKLPYPEIMSTRASENDTKIYSDIYVYI